MIEDKQIESLREKLFDAERAYGTVSTERGTDSLGQSEAQLEKGPGCVLCVQAARRISMNSRPAFLRPLEQSYPPYREVIRWRRRFWLSIALWVGLVFFLLFRR
jgi:hypothetical protein